MNIDPRQEQPITGETLQLLEMGGVAYLSRRQLELLDKRAPEWVRIRAQWFPEQQKFGVTIEDTRAANNFERKSK